MGRMNWDRVRLENRDYHAKTKGHDYPMDDVRYEPPPAPRASTPSAPSDSRPSCPVCQVRLRSMERLNRHLTSVHHWPPAGPPRTMVWRPPAPVRQAKAVPRNSVGPRPTAPGDAKLTVTLHGPVAAQVRERSKLERITPEDTVLRALAAYLSVCSSSRRR
jgi:hypothetical protein